MKQEIDGANLWNKYDALLAPYAQTNKNSLGRQYQEKEDPDRLPFQHDCGRIEHSKFYHRLEGKMQVLPADYDDHSQSRGPHSHSYAPRTVRDIARVLGFNEDLCEFGSKAHDIGHPPFGHAGEDALNECMKNVGLELHPELKSLNKAEQKLALKKLGFYFNHNDHGLRVVEILATEYKEEFGFYGLNLHWESQIIFKKHEKTIILPDGQTIYYSHGEGQLVDVGDKIAYLSVDTNDALSENFFTIKDMQDIPLCWEAMRLLKKNERNNPEALVNRMFGLMINWLIADTRANLNDLKEQTLEAIQNKKDPVVAFADNTAQKVRELKQFLFTYYYNSDRILEFTETGKQKITDLFKYLMETEESKLPKNLQDHIQNFPKDPRYRQVCDYIAGMTDRYTTKMWKEHCQ